MVTTSPTPHSQLPTADTDSPETSGGATRSQTEGRVAEWDEASFFHKWTYSVVNAMLSRGEQSPLQHGELSPP